MQTSYTVLDDAQIKALPSTPVVLIPALGPRKLVIPRFLVYERNFIAGYTGTDLSPQLYHQDGPGTGLTPVQSITLTTGEAISWVPAVTELQAGAGTFAGYIFGGSGAIDNKAIIIEDNWASGDYGGGDPANVLKLYVHYVVIDLSPYGN